MKRSARQLVTVERRFSRLARMFVVLLCALYVVAPLWHVCEMSGSHCEHETSQTAPSSTRLTICAASNDESAHHEDELCVCPEHEREAKQHLSRFEVSPRDADFNGTCLARLLSVTPSQISTSFAFSPRFSPRTSIAIRTFRACSVSSLPQPPVRGPPVSM